MRYFIVTMLFALLTSCASLPSQQEAAAADYGTYPSNYEQVVKGYYDNTLKDPGSAQYRDITLPKQFWLGDRFTGAHYGYLVCATLNAKNSYGAYIGFQTDGLLIHNGIVVQYVPKGAWFGRQVC